MMFEIELQRTCAENRAAAVTGPVYSAKHGTHTRDELTQQKWLGDVVIGAGLERTDFIVFTVADGDHHDAGVGSKAANSTARFDSTDATHIDVQEHEVERMLSHDLDGLFAG